MTLGVLRFSLRRGKFPEARGTLIGTRAARSLSICRVVIVHSYGCDVWGSSTLTTRHDGCEKLQLSRPLPAPAKKSGRGKAKGPRGYFLRRLRRSRRLRAVTCTGLER